MYYKVHCNVLQCQHLCTTYKYNIRSCITSAFILSLGIDQISPVVLDCHFVQWYQLTLINTQRWDKSFICDKISHCIVYPIFSVAYKCKWSQSTREDFLGLNIWYVWCMFVWFIICFLLYNVLSWTFGPNILLLNFWTFL